MHFLLILAVLAALIVSENSPPEPVSAPGFRLAVSLAGMLLVPLVAAVASAWLAGCLRQAQASRDWVVRQLKVVRGIHLALWLAVAFGVLFGLGWPRLVRYNWHLDRAFLLDELLILAPVLLPVILSWLGFYQIDCELRRGSAARPDFTRRQYLMVHVRHYFGLLMAPVFALLAIQDVAELLAPGFRESHFALAVYIPTVAAIIFFFPVLLRHVWDTQSLPAGGLRTRLENAAHRAGFHPRDILVWRTDRMIVNAAVAGFFPALRYVFLTDGLLTQLTEDEIHAVFGHEIGHMRHRHLLLRVLAMLAPVSLWLLLSQIAPTLQDKIQAMIATGGMALQTEVCLTLLMAMASYMLLVFGPFCRLLEGQADLFGCKSLACEASRQPVQTFISALENLALASGLDRNSPSWQHASIARRVEFLKRTTENPDYELHFQRRVRWLSVLIVVAVLSPLAGPLLSLV